eukprot:9467217-Pyramimonas_sp.AAC.1
MGQFHAWVQEDLAAAAAARTKLERAHEECLLQLGDVLRERRKYKAPNLALWKELGTEAKRFLREHVLLPNKFLLTQWSAIIIGSTADDDIERARAVAELAEKGD